MPLVAAFEVLMATTNGTASPNAWGQAMTNTVATREMTSTLNPYPTVQKMAVNAAATTAM